MRYENIKEYRDEQFRRLTGVKKKTFEKMAEVFGLAEQKGRTGGGPKPKLGTEDSLLAALSYWREYRTYAHIAADYGVSESQIYRIIKRAEDTLIKDGIFSLPGKKALYKSDVEYEVILIDATETPIERPKRGKSGIIPAKRNATP